LEPVLLPAFCRLAEILVLLAMTVHIIGQIHRADYVPTHRIPTNRNIFQRTSQGAPHRNHGTHIDTMQF
jgi:hypothetical protein